MLQGISTTSTISTISTTTTTVSSTTSQIIGKFKNCINLILCGKNYNFIADSNSISILSELGEEPEVHVGDLERSIQYIVNKEISAQAKI